MSIQMAAVQKPWRDECFCKVFREQAVSTVHSYSGTFEQLERRQKTLIFSIAGLPTKRGH